MEAMQFRTDEGPPASDNKLLAQYVAGDAKGADALFGRYSRGLYVYFLRRLGRRDLAEEGLQETFCRLLERACRLVHHPRLEAWLFSVARNVYADECRRRRGWLTSFSEIREGRMEPALADPRSTDPESLVESSERNAILLRAMEEMPPAEREVFLLRTQATLSFKEIAALVDAPLNTVLSRMHRAMKRVRAALAGKPVGEPHARRELP